MPNTWKDPAIFRESLKEGEKKKKEIWRKTDPDSGIIDYFYAFEEQYYTKDRGYPVHWIFSSEKKKNDRYSRLKKIAKAENLFKELLEKINKKDLKKKRNIQEACDKILAKCKVEKCIKIDLGEIEEMELKQIGKGRPSKNTQYKAVYKTIYTLNWSLDKKAIKREERADGVFPLLCTDPKMKSSEVLEAYKYQPRLEKRFSQFKSVHNAAPLLFKRVDRVEANMFLFFLALMLQALIEREIRHKMKHHQLTALKVYPENRDASHPTTSKIFDIFSDVSTYSIKINDQVFEQYEDELNPVQNKILEFLAIEPAKYWKN